MESGDSTRQLVEDYKALQKDLAKQTARAERAEGQMKLTEKSTVRETDVKKLAKERAANVGSDVNANEITKRMTELGNKIVQAGRGSLEGAGLLEEADQAHQDDCHKQEG